MSEVAIYSVFEVTWFALGSRLSATRFLAVLQSSIVFRLFFCIWSSLEVLLSIVPM